MYKRDSPSAAESRNKPTQLGELLSVDAFGPFSTPALGTGWTHIIGAHDVGGDIVDGIGSREPTGKICASFIDEVCAIYATVYKKPVQAIMFDNGTPFTSHDVSDVLVKWKVTRYQTWRTFIGSCGLSGIRSGCNTMVLAWSGSLSERRATSSMLVCTLLIFARAFYQRLGRRSLSTSSRPGL